MAAQSKLPSHFLGKYLPAAGKTRRKSSDYVIGCLRVSNLSGSSLLFLCGRDKCAAWTWISENSLEINTLLLSVTKRSLLGKWTFAKWNTGDSGESLNLNGKATQVGNRRWNYYSLREISRVRENKCGNILRWLLTTGKSSAGRNTVNLFAKVSHSKQRCPHVAEHTGDLSILGWTGSCSCGSFLWMWDMRQWLTLGFRLGFGFGFIKHF